MSNPMTSALSATSAKGMSAIHCMRRPVLLPPGRPVRHGPRARAPRRRGLSCSTSGIFSCRVSRVKVANSEARPESFARSPSSIPSVLACVKAADCVAAASPHHQACAYLTARFGRRSAG
jgi:hypothetical protein